MSTANGSTTQTAATPDDSTSIQLPPPPTPPKRKQTTSEQLAVEITRLDRVLVVLVLAFAFLSASFTARNTDLWQHLAVGRMIVAGEYHFGTDPFAFTTETVYWAHHAWFVDLIVYGVAQAAGGIESRAAGIVLVGLKALLISLLAAILMGIRRPGQSLWAPAFFTALAVLAISMRALLQPTVVSFLFLAITLCILHRPGLLRGRNTGARGTYKAYWWLVPLFVLWVNLDRS